MIPKKLIVDLIHRTCPLPAPMRNAARELGLRVIASEAAPQEHLNFSCPPGGNVHIRVFDTDKRFVDLILRPSDPDIFEVWIPRESGSFFEHGRVSNSNYEENIRLWLSQAGSTQACAQAAESVHELLGL